MEQGGEKENNHARTACLSSAHQRKFLLGFVQCLVHKQGKAHSAHPQASRSVFGNSSWPWGHQGAQSTCPTHLPPPGCSHDLTLTPHLGKAVPMSHKNTPRKSHQALEHLKHSEPAQPGLFRADRAAENRPHTGTRKDGHRDAGRPEQPLPLLSHTGTIQKHKQKYFTVKDFRPLFLECSAC